MADDLRTPAPPDREGTHEGAPYLLWLPQAAPPWGGMLILHGAGSRKENHADFGRAAAAAGFAALAYDQRGHGGRSEPMGPAAVADIGRMAAFLGGIEGVEEGRVCVRGSSLGGHLAISGAASSDALAGVIAICPAGDREMTAAIRDPAIEMAVDAEAFAAWIAEHPLDDAVLRIAPRPLIILHAEGDEQVPVEGSRRLAERAGDSCRLIVVPGGHHRSVQHDAELQGEALRWIERRLAG